MTRYVRFAGIHGPRWGVHDPDTNLVAPIDGAPWDGPASLPEPPLALTGLALLPPVTPTKIVCVGRNYREHAAELGNPLPSEPLLFLKPPSALLAPGGAIELPPESNRVEHEAELGLVIGRRVRRATADEVARTGAIFGATCVDDVTARDLQKTDVQFTRAKGFDTFCPAGPALVEGLHLADLFVALRVNGAVRQNGRTRDMVFSAETLVAFISGVMTLEPGDLIATGTPAGVGPLIPGDLVEVEVEGIGVLTNQVIAAASR
ncbi:MAG: fumarylacetoacetate hydrolase family protein [Deltaproteobacteria bacterium]|nr:fumarylacetoacetate hydrolase family protein [Deltaproteobacteria bacterium]